MTLEVGQEAPDFTARDQHGAEVTLSQYRGTKNVVLVFYPWSFSGTCTGELCVLRDRFDVFDTDDTITIAVSCDSIFTQRAFASQEGYMFSILEDHWPHGAIAKAYGVFNEQRGAALRGTFIIDKNGIVRWSIVHPIGQGRDADAYAAVLATL